MQCAFPKASECLGRIVGLAHSYLSIWCCHGPPRCGIIVSTPPSDPIFVVLAHVQRESYARMVLGGASWHMTPFGGFPQTGIIDASCPLGTSACQVQIMS
ncbi:hypothetical protein LX32DRAFT_95108 [Colletotrichum zoysiae]|uniref:Uncharacterized protein n=1 Tax=Colletotrichum zoysiae TaxID=1216348 RepID=A0AAD9HA63_9PEZI|nr:hypothetical protein LX32DRAFT_95108 [Colletotrichum zoysiae]